MKKHVELQKMLLNACDGLQLITTKKMFGCDALWANRNVFALVWKTGRIAIKFPEKTIYDFFVNVPGAEQWKAGTKRMPYWVTFPESAHSDHALLKTWVQKSYDLCSVLEDLKKPKTRKLADEAFIKKLAQRKS